MPTIKRVEARIRKIDGFQVRFLHGRDGRDVRSDKTDIPQYPYERALDAAKTVKEWRDGRFTPNYPGFTVEVLTSDGAFAHGRTKLENLRRNYL